MPRSKRPYVRVADSLLHEPWPRDVKLMSVLLSCYMHERWRAERITLEEASTVTLSKAMISEITGKSRADVAAKSLQRLADFVSMSLQREGEVAVISWPKWAIFQGSHVPLGPQSEAASRVPNPSPEEEEKAAPFTAPADPEREPQKPEASSAQESELVVDGEPFPRRLVESVYATWPALTRAGFTLSDCARWYALMKPKMRARGIKDYRRAALNWSAGAARRGELQEEIRAAKREWKYRSLEPGSLVEPAASGEVVPLHAAPSDDAEPLTADVGIRIDDLFAS